jgi:hypothetical protein
MAGLRAAGSRTPDVHDKGSAAPNSGACRGERLEETVVVIGFDLAEG